MKTYFRTLGFFVLVVAALATMNVGVLYAAGQIDMTTYYDAPDGDFKELDVTGSPAIGSGAGSLITFGEGGGLTSIGAAAGATRPLTVTSTVNATTASFMKSNGYGVMIGAPNGANYGLVAGKNPAGAEAPLYLNTAGGNVNIGDPTTLPTHQLQINGTLGITQGANTGEVKFAWATDGYYATYAA